MRISDWSSDVCSSDLHWALLRRQMRFGTIALLETSAELTAAAIAIALAWHGAGYWALVVQRQGCRPRRSDAALLDRERGHPRHQRRELAAHRRLACTVLPLPAVQSDRPVFGSL